MVSATESLYGTDAVLSVDPYVDNGIEEAEITTVLLSEASTAREGVALLTSIYDNAGAAGGSGVFIADQNETWFVENLTGHTYLALKLSSSVVFMQPNIAAMGKIDLDDTDHVVASANLISVAQKAGTFVGDAAANVIDLDASYNGDIASDRMAAGLNYLYGTDTFTKDNYSETDFAISNIGENGAIVPVYSNIQLTKKFSVEDSIHFFQTEPIGKTGNVETHLFQVSATGDLNTAITEWTAFDDDVYNAFVPYYPMLTTDTADVYKVSVHKVTVPTSSPPRAPGIRDAKGRYYTYPDDWTDSFYGVRDALSNLLTYGSNGNQVTAKEIIEGSNIAQYFSRVYASSYLYSADGVAEWPAQAVNYTNKTQFIFRIAKGIFEEYDERVNDSVPESALVTPYENIVYIGDSATDIPLYAPL